MKIFQVNDTSDWQPVTVYLMSNINPVPEPDGVYSTTESEALRKAERLIAAGRAEEAMKYTIAVVYKRATVISITLTREPNVLHLSMTRVDPATSSLQPLEDAIAKEAADHLLNGDYEARGEGVLPTVRHYFQAAGTS